MTYHWLSRPKRPQTGYPRSLSARHGMGLLALAFWCVHANTHLWRGTPEHLLWTCHAADLGVGVGLLLGRRWLTAAATLVLLVGTPAWFVNLFIRGTFLPTSLLPHVGGLVLGLIGLKLLGPPEGDWWKALGMVAMLLLVSRSVTSETANVNLVFGVWPQTAAWWPLPGPPLLSALGVWAIALWTGEYCLRRWS